MGVDVAAETFVAAWLAPGGKPGTPGTGEQTPAGFVALQRRLRATGSPPTATRIVLEATGNDRVALAVALHEAGYRVAVVNPRQAQTDALDARDLAQRAAAPRPAPGSPPPAAYHAVRQRLVARDGLLLLRTQARNQRHALRQGVRGGGRGAPACICDRANSVLERPGGIAARNSDHIASPVRTTSVRLS